MHWVADARLRGAIADYLERERHAVDAEVAWLDGNTARRRDGGEDEP
jgi:predicted N-acyltransferase